MHFQTLEGFVADSLEVDCFGAMVVTGQDNSDTCAGEKISQVIGLFEGIVAGGRLGIVAFPDQVVTKKKKTDKLIFQPICPLLLPLLDLNQRPSD